MSHESNKNNDFHWKCSNRETQIPRITLNGMRYPKFRSSGARVPFFLCFRAHIFVPPEFSAVCRVVTKVQKTPLKMHRGYILLKYSSSSIVHHIFENFDRKMVVVPSRLWLTLFNPRLSGSVLAQGPWSQCYKLTTQPAVRWCSVCKRSSVDVKPSYSGRDPPFLLALPPPHSSEGGGGGGGGASPKGGGRAGGWQVGKGEGFFN